MLLIKALQYRMFRSRSEHIVYNACTAHERILALTSADLCHCSRQL